MYLSSYRQTLLSRGAAVWHCQRWACPLSGEVNDRSLSAGSPWLSSRQFVPSITSILPLWGQYALDRQLNAVDSVQVCEINSVATAVPITGNQASRNFVQGWDKLVRPKLGSLTGTQALMCVSELGDLVQAAKTEGLKDAETVKSIDGTLDGLTMRLKQHTGHAASGRNRLDSTMLGAGLKTARQLEIPMDSKQAHKVFQNHSKVLKDVLLDEGKLTTQALFDGYHPEQGWKQPIDAQATETFQMLCQGLACVADPQCRIETLLARAISAHAPQILAPLPGDAQALALRVVLDTHVIKGCVTQELQHVLRSDAFWAGVTATLNSAAPRMSLVMLTGLLETLLIVQRLTPELRQRLGAELQRGIGGDAGRDADVVILMHMPAGRRDAEAAGTAGAAVLRRLRVVAEEKWRGPEFLAALAAAVKRGAAPKAPVRPGVWAVAALVDELATAKVGELKGEEVYAIDAALEELRFGKSKLLEQHLVREMTGRR